MPDLAVATSSTDSGPLPPSDLPDVDAVADRPLSVLLIEDSPADARIARAAIEATRVVQIRHLAHADSLQRARALLRSGNSSDFDVILLDLHLPDGAGIECVHTVREMAPDTAVVILTSMRDESFVLKSMAASVQDYIVKDELLDGDVGRAIQRAISRQACSNALRADAERARWEAMRDPLTGLPNRALFAEYFEKALARAQRDGYQLALAWFDLCGFKALNDLHGHAWGDAALVDVADALQRGCRRGDAVARHGGDEFVALLTPLRGADEARIAVQRMVAAIHDLPDGPDGTRLTVSAGFACWPEDGACFDTLLHQADAAMYQAKRTGSAVPVAITDFDHEVAEPPAARDAQRCARLL